MHFSLVSLSVACSSRPLSLSVCFFSFCVSFFLSFSSCLLAHVPRLLHCLRVCTVSTATTTRGNRCSCNNDYKMKERRDKKHTANTSAEGTQLRSNENGVFVRAFTSCPFPRRYAWSKACANSTAVILTILVSCCVPSLTYNLALRPRARVGTFSNWDQNTQLYVNGAACEARADKSPRNVKVTFGCLKDSAVCDLRCIGEVVELTGDTFARSRL